MANVVNEIPTVDLSLKSHKNDQTKFYKKNKKQSWLSR